MHLVAAFFVSAFGALFGYFAKFLGQRVAIGAALTASVVAASLTFYGAIQILISGLLLAIDNDWFLMVFYAIWPSNASACISACLAADVAVFIYRHKIRLMTTIAQVG